MKVTLDLDQLLAEGKISRAEYDKFATLSASGTGSLAFNILLGFGVVAVAAGLIALVPDATVGIIVGLALLGGGLGLYAARTTNWEVLAHICVMIGALMLAGGVVILTEASVVAFLAITAGFALVGVLAKSSLLVALSVLALSSSVGARTGYMHATYFLGIEEPTATIVLFSLLALATYHLSKAVGVDYERLALTAARTSVFLVNFGFWIGSLWGDTIEEIGLQIPYGVFALLWAVALVATGVWGAMRNRRWVVNVVAVFAVIHLYTQWFEWLSFNAASLLGAGIVALLVAIGLWHFNRQLWRRHYPARQLASAASKGVP